VVKLRYKNNFTEGRMKNTETQRKKHNEILLERMKDPSDRLTDKIDTQTRWFPPRPVIQKDKKAIEKIFDKD